MNVNKNINAFGCALVTYSLNKRTYAPDTIRFNGREYSGKAPNFRFGKLHYGGLIRDPHLPLKIRIRGSYPHVKRAIAHVLLKK